VPWCERCDRFLNPNTVATDGTCPSCGRTIEPTRSDLFQEVAVRDPDTEIADAVDDEDRVRAPWHFWLMIGAVVAYLGWRLVQGIFWAAHHWF
jgi:RNA polymerase subunit RPABC4/transcription elongation factor Spt4